MAAYFSLVSSAFLRATAFWARHSATRESYSAFQAASSTTGSASELEGAPKDSGVVGTGIGGGTEDAADMSCTEDGKEIGCVKAAGRAACTLG